jgi:hypothetical protein
MSALYLGGLNIFNLQSQQNMNTAKKTILATLLALSVVNAGCVSSTANPVPVAQVGDDTKSCDAIINEMQQMINARLQADGDRNSQVAGNVALGVLGAFLLVPWFFMDTSNAHTVEERAAQARFDRLQQMAIDRKCSNVPVYTPPTQDPTTNTTAANPTGTVERVTLTNQGAMPNATSSNLSFEAARDSCGKTFKESSEQYGNCVLQSSKSKPSVVAQIGYTQVCENIGFKKDTAQLTSCVNQLLARPIQ